MEWSELTPLIWRELSAQAAQHPQMVAAQPLYHNGNALTYMCIFVSNDKSFHLIIEPEDSMEKLINPKASGLKIGMLIYFYRS